MNLEALTARAMEIHGCFATTATRQERPVWSRQDVMQGFVVDVGALMKLTMAKERLRHVDHLDAKLAHELADCLWSVLVLARLHGVDLEQAFVKTMNDIERSLRPDSTPGTAPADPAAARDKSSPPLPES